MIVFQRYLVAAGLALQLFLAITSLQHKGITYDEPRHFSYGLHFLNGSPQWQDLPEMPFSVLNVLFLDKRADFQTQIQTGRYVTVIFLLALSLIVFYWSKELYGPTAAIFSLYLFCLDPNFIAHGHLVTCDIYAALTITLALYSYWKFLKRGRLRYGILSAATLGISQLAKYTSLYLYPVFLFILIWKGFPVIVRCWQKRSFSLLGRWKGPFLKYFFIFFLINVLIINAGYGFYRTGVPLKDYIFKSHLFQSLQRVPVVNRVPLPLPYPYVEGIDFMNDMDHTGEFSWNTYLLGHLQDKGKGFKGYYFVAMFFKTPLAVLCMIGMALVSCWYRRRGYGERGNAVFFLLPVIFYLILFNFFLNADVGIRYILFIFPLLYIFCGGLFTAWERYSLRLKVFFISLIFYLAVSVFSYFPHYISYFNELVPDRKMAYTLLADSNLDWGDDRWYLEEYLKKHPESVVLPASPIPGHIIVNVNSLVGIFDQQQFSWLRDNFKPVDQIAGSYLVYDIKWSDMKTVFPHL
jgi:4-amino-4-deoxy-L-arabinose transferase-like glycosyltransferase